MYQTLLFSHSILRWLVLLALGYSIYRGYKGVVLKKAFSKLDNSIRHWTATLSHVQLMVGMILYFQSPSVKYFWSKTREGDVDFEVVFFSLVHLLLMFVAIVIITVGSSLAKRKLNDQDKFKTMMVWFALALVIIFVAIPWPFSPLANRPYLR